MPMFIIGSPGPHVVNPAVLLAADFNDGAGADLSSYQHGTPITVVGQGAPTFSGGIMHIENNAGGGPADPSDAVYWNLPEIVGHGGEAITVEGRIKCIVAPEVLGQPELVQLARGAELVLRAIGLAGDGNKYCVLTTRTSITHNSKPFSSTVFKHAAMVCPAGTPGSTVTGRVYLDGVLASTHDVTVINASNLWYVSFLYKHAGNPASHIDFDWVFVKLGESYTGSDTVNPNFTPPVEMPSLY